MYKIALSRTSKLFITALSLTLLAIILRTAISLNIDRLPWFSLLSPELTIACDNEQTIYKFTPNIMINATSNKLLLEVMSTISEISWEKKVVFGKSHLKSVFSHDGYEYGGIWVIGPYISITLDKPESSASCSHPSTSYKVKIIDVRDICADSIKNGICSKKPFQ